MRLFSYSIRFLPIFVALLLSALHLFLCAPSAFAADTETPLLNAAAQWQTLGDDLELLRGEVNNSFLFSTELVAVRTSLKRYRVRTLRSIEVGRQRTTIERLCTAAKAAVCINANFFDEQGKPLGLVLSGGNVIQGIHAGGKTLTGIFYVGRDRLGISNRSDFTARSILEAVQAGPRLIVGGRSLNIMRADSSPSRRSTACIDKEQRLILSTIHSKFSGVSIRELTEIHNDSRFSCVDALNLDGGGSSQFYLSSSIIGGSNSSEPLLIEGQDSIPVALGLIPN